MSARIAIGVGCREAASSAAIIGIVNEALEQVGERPGERVIFTSEAKRGATNIEEAARELGLALIYLPQDDLIAAAPRAVTRSERVQRHIGLPSLAECAALAGAGAASELIVSRLAAGGATCAIAYSPETQS